MFKRFIEKHGAINLTMALTTLISLVGLLVGVIYANAAERIGTLETKSETFVSDISGLKTDVSWIKGALEARGFSPKK